MSLKMSEKIKLKLNMDLGTNPNHKKGKVVTLDSSDGIPIDRFWRRRLQDSLIDNCVEVVVEKSTKRGK